jgi:deoxyribonuclease V
MHLAFDTYYTNEQAHTVCLAFENNGDAVAAKQFSETTAVAGDYEPGAFYKRELPAILSLFKKIAIHKIDTIIIDGFVVLDDAGKPGLGMHLFEALEKRIPVIGVAKTNFTSLHQQKRTVLRGNSERQLYVTAVGMDVDDAANFISSMHGKYRLPTLLKELDRLTKLIQ